VRRASTRGAPRRRGVLPRQRGRPERPGGPARRRDRLMPTDSHLLVQRAAAELLGTAFLVAAVIGSGVAAQRLSPSDTGLQLLENSVVTGAALVALILALQPGAASFHPVVTLVERALGRITSRDALGLVTAQVLGGLLG